MKKLLIFDAYGTLISTGNGSIEAVERMLSLQDKAIEAKAFYADWKKYHRKHIDECIAGEFICEKDIFVKDLRVLYELYDINRPFEKDVNFMLESLVGRKVFPEVAEAIAKLRNRYRVVIGSTTDTEPLLTNMRQNQLMVDKVYTSEMIGKYKPDVRFYQYILEQEGYHAKDAVFIGDSLVDDIAGPQKVGIITILVDRKGVHEESNDVKPDYVVRSIAEIEELKLVNEEV